MKILTDKQYKEKLAEERDRAWREECVDRRLCDMQDAILRLSNRIDNLESKSITECGTLKPLSTSY